MRRSGKATQWNCEEQGLESASISILLDRLAVLNASGTFAKSEALFLPSFPFYLERYCVSVITNDLFLVPNVFCGLLSTVENWPVVSQFAETGSQMLISMPLNQFDRFRAIFHLPRAAVFLGIGRNLSDPCS